ncbi:MAG: LytTR family DNA-binding domain-containing protein [Acidobacteriia bacterium]|nr:LytTR family DNA-binding domain-containing protein [Terriglobia bacterium]
MTSAGVLTVLIVDDEPLARRRLRKLLGDEPGVEVVGECGDGASAVEAVRRLKPDVLLLDVQMPGMDGFDAIDAIGPERCPAVIFVTAFDKYALKAFDVHAADYLLKPFDRARLRRAIGRARAAAVHATDVGRRLLALVTEVRDRRPLERIVVKAAGRVHFVRAGEIDWIEAAGHYVLLHAGAEVHEMRDTLARLEARLDAGRFVRVHRSAIVNVDRIKELLPSFHGEFVVVLRDGTRVASSRGYSDRLREMVETG